VPVPVVVKARARCHIDVMPADPVGPTSSNSCRSAHLDANVNAETVASVASGHKTTNVLIRITKRRKREEEKVDVVDTNQPLMVIGFGKQCCPCTEQDRPLGGEDYHPNRLHRRCLGPGHQGQQLYDRHVICSHIARRGYHGHCPFG
jgi:hypothetical protein